MSVTMMLWATTAFGGSQVEVVCPPSGRPVYRYKRPEKACEKLFRSQFARDFSLDVAVSLEREGVSSELRSKVVQLADQINGDLQAHYKGACAAAQSDPCGPGMESFTSAQSALTSVFANLRVRLSGVRSDEDLAALREDVDAVQAALAGNAALSEEILGKVNWLLEPTCSAPEQRGWGGAWTVRSEGVMHGWEDHNGVDREACPVEFAGSISDVWTLAESADGKLTASVGRVPGQAKVTAFEALSGSVDGAVARLSATVPGSGAHTEAELRLMPDGTFEGARVIWVDEPAACVRNFRVTGSR